MQRAQEHRSFFVSVGFCSVGVHERDRAPWVCLRAAEPARLADARPAEVRAASLSTSRSSRCSSQPQKDLYHGTALADR